MAQAKQQTFTHKPQIRLQSYPMNVLDRCTFLGSPLSKNSNRQET
jgi:hypothetical protein